MLNISNSFILINLWLIINTLVNVRKIMSQYIEANRSTLIITSSKYTIYIDS